MNIFIHVAFVPYLLDYLLKSDFQKQNYWIKGFCLFVSIRIVILIF